MAYDSTYDERPRPMPGGRYEYRSSAGRNFAVGNPEQ